MRVLHLSTSVDGGAGIAARRLNDCLNLSGMQSKLYSLDSDDIENNHDSVFQIKRNWLRRKQSSSLTLLQGKIVQKSDALFTALTLDEKIKLKKFIDDFEVIHIHSTYNLTKVTSILSTINPDTRVYLHLHDQRPFTGGCHYSFSCRGFAQNCAKCPQVNKFFQPYIKNQFMQDSKALADFNNLTAVSPSKWLLNLARTSTPLREVRSIQIRNPIPNHFFESSRIENEKKVITYIAANLNNPYKGFNIFVDAIRALPKRFFDDKLIRIIGKGHMVQLPNYIFFEHIETQSEAQLLNTYSKTDLLIIPSIEDNSPNVIAEALASGCHIIGSNAGGIPEMLEPFQLGIFAREESEDLMQKILNHDFSRCVPYSRKKVQQKYGYAAVSKNFADDYRL